MTAEDRVPPWLESALGANPPVELAAEPLTSSRDVRPGDICQAVAMDPGATPARLVLILAAHHREHYVEVALLSPTSEDAADLDVRLTPGDTSLPFELLAQADVVGTLWVWQVSEPIGHAGADVADAVRKLSRGDSPVEFAGRRGMPFAGRSDPRWRGKEKEVEHLQALADDCLRTLLQPAWIDPGVLDTEISAPAVVQAAVLAAFDLSTTGAARLPGAALDAIDLGDDDKRLRAEASIGTDAWLLVQEMALAALAADGPRVASASRSLEIPGRRRPAVDDPLGVALGAVRNVLTVRLETWDYLWTGDAPDVVTTDGPNGTVRVLRERVLL